MTGDERRKRDFVMLVQTRLLKDDACTPGKSLEVLDNAMHVAARSLPVTGLEQCANDFVWWQMNWPGSERPKWFEFGPRT